MYGQYSLKHYGGDDNDEERCVTPPSRHHHHHGTSARRRGSHHRQHGVRTGEARFSKDKDKSASDKPSSERHDGVDWFYHSSQVTGTTGSLGEDEYAVGENATTATSDTVPHSTPRSRQRSGVRPGAFYDDGRNAQDVTVSEDWSTTVHQSDQSTNEHSELDVLVSAHTVDPNETQRIVELELAEQRRHAPVAEIVKGYWCSPRVKRLCIVGGLLVIVAIILGTVLPPVLETPAPTAAPTPAPTPVEPYLESEISSRSPDGGEALRAASTPQNKSFTWLLNNTYLDTYPLDKKIQRYVLATLYYSTNGDNWRRNSSWLSDDDECGWYNEARASFCIDSEVVDLDLYSNRRRRLTRRRLPSPSTGNNLVGTIPNEIALLSNSLEELQLSGNTLMGMIPSEIGALSKMKAISLWDNNLTGSFPQEICSLTNLKRVNLRANRLVGTIVSEIGFLTNTQVLSFSMNKVAGTIPTEIGLLTRLSSLYLYDNQLTGTIPTEINMLTNLRTLALYNNSLTGDYTCRESIAVCQISCANETLECRSLQAEPPAPSSMPSMTDIPSLVPSMEYYSLIPSTMVDADSPTVLPTEFTRRPLPPSPPELPTSSVSRPSDPATNPPTPRPTPHPILPIPTPRPTTRPTKPPASLPIPASPTMSPMPRPTTAQTPTPVPTIPPTPRPTPDPTIHPAKPPFPVPTTARPAMSPTGRPTLRPTMQPTLQPTPFPTIPPTMPPKPWPTPFPTIRPTMLPTPKPAPTIPPTIVCGDGIIDDGENCEPERPPYCPDGQFCHQIYCRCTGCGNGRIDEGEECDYSAWPDGCEDIEYCSRKCDCIRGSPPVCDEECKIEGEPPYCPAGQYCINDCTCTACGNGKIDEDEECDYEAKPTGCREEGQYCTSSCQCSTCENRKIDKGEECDYTVEPSGCGEKEYCSHDYDECTCVPWGTYYYD